MSTTKLKTSAPIIDKVVRSAPATPRESDPFPILCGELFDQLPIAAIRLEIDGSETDSRQIRRMNRASMIKAFQQGVAVLQQRIDDINRLLGGIIESQVRPINGSLADSWALRGEKIGSMLAKMQRPKLEVIDVLRAELMGRPDKDVLQMLRDAMREMANDVIGQLQQMISTLQSQNVAGSITWFDVDVCKYHYFEYRRGTRKVTSPTTHTSERRVYEETAWVTYEVVHRTTNLEKYDVCTRVEHHLFSAARHQFPAPDVPKPAHLAPLFKTIPDWLAPHVFIVEGDMLRETFQDQTQQVSVTPIATHEVGRKEIGREQITTGLNYSPAVTIGSLVIGGWSKADL